MRLPMVYACSPGLRWVKDGWQTLLVDDATARSWTLTGDEAALWDYLALNLAYDDVLRLFAALLDLPNDEAEPRLASTLAAWRQAGILTGSGGT
jgi:hypothetical protein